MKFGALAMVSACSFAAVSGPSTVTPDGRGEVDCTTSRVAPIVDTILTLVQVVDITFTARESRSTWDSHFCASDDPSCSAPVPRGGAIAIYSVLGLASAASAVYGFMLTAQCHELKSSINRNELGTQHVTP
jgi:hypothetical protein